MILGTAACSANTLLDPFGPQSNCNYGPDAPYSSCDVIGDQQLYDIQAATFTTGNGMATVSIYLNSGAVRNDLTLGSFTDAGLTLIPGDIFFYSPSTVYNPADPTTIPYLQYGIALTDHGSLQAGGLYAIGGGISTETAQAALGDPNDYYRKDETVLMTGSGTPVSMGTVNVALAGGTGAQYVITVTVPEAGLAGIESNGDIGLLFSSADCANDVIQGTVGAPEPGSGILMLTGLALFVGGGIWRKRTR
jgi:hypothetical protein